ncbi:MAG: hypothetical protein GF307_01495 [candidate division Zixibacteria bacterium]|nr:hypothetical protein [candidate division Zixibacteria bacterium]
MKDILDELTRLQEHAEEMAEIIKKVKTAIGSRDYDLERLMKNVEADFMDMSHKINLVNRLARGQSHE